MSKDTHSHDSEGGSGTRLVGSERNGDKITERFQDYQVCSCGSKHSYSNRSNTYTIKKKVERSHRAVLESQWIQRL